MPSQAPRWFLTFEAVTRATNRAFAAASSALALVIVAAVIVAVLARMASATVLWPHDVAQFALLYLFFLALAPALESGHHVGVELFDSAVPRAIRRYIFHIAALLVITFGCILLWQLWRTTARAFADDRLAIAAIAVPLKWIYIAGPIGSIQFILTGLAQLGRAQWPVSGPALQTAGH